MSKPQKKRRRTLNLSGYRPPKGVKSWYRESSGWHVIFHDEGRTPKSKWVRLDTHADPIAATRFVEKAQAYDLGTFDPWSEATRALTFDEAKEAFLAADPRLRQTTRDERRMTLDLFAAGLPGGGALALSAVRPADVRAFIYRKARPRRTADGTVQAASDLRELSSSTRAGYFARLRTFFRWAVKNRALRDDPSAEVERPRVERKVPAYLSPADVDRVLTAFHDHLLAKSDKIQPGALEWFEPVVRFAVNTGMRLGEITSLRWRDVSFGTGDRPGRVYVRNYVRADGTERKTKTGRERAVPMTAECRAVLRTLQEARADEDDDRPVFQGMGGGKLDDNRVSRTFRKYRDLARLPKTVHFHSLRHTAASWMVSRSVPLRVVQDVLGHSSIRSTEIYSHLLPGASDVVVEAMDGARSAGRPAGAGGGAAGGAVSIDDLSPEDRERLLKELLLAQLQGK